MILASAFHHASSGWLADLPGHLDHPNTLVLAFGSRSLLDAPGPLQTLAQAFPTAVLLGCSSAGEIASKHVGDDSLSVVIARFERSTLCPASTPLQGIADSQAAGARLAAQLPGAGLRTVLLLSAGLNVNGTALVRGLREGLPAGVSISGGLAGDGTHFERTWVLHGGLPCEHRVSAVGLYGDALQVGHGCSGGWFDFGPPRTITRAQGNVLFELDGQPALALYRHYLGDLASQLPGSALRFPLSLRAGEGATTAVVRTILGIDDAAQSMTFAGDMPTGAVVRLMRTTIDSLIESAEDAGTQALLGTASNSPGHEQPVLALSVSCIGRRLVMRERTEEEVEAVAEQLPSGSVHAGFYSYGEISPSGRGGVAELHNQTMTITTLTEV